MKETLIIPSEKAPSLREIKRALLTFDKVKLSDPSDRDIIPRNTFLRTLGVPMLSVDSGPVRPLGKVANHDTDFQRLLDEIQPAREEGLVEVVSTYDRQETNRNTIGTVPLGGFPLDPRFVLGVYRSVASKQEFLSAVLDEEEFRGLHSSTNLESLVLPGVADGGLNKSPALPMIEKVGFRDDEVSAVTSMARARLGSIIKFTGFCEAKDLVPTYLEDGYTRTISTLLKNTREFLANRSADHYWVRRNRVLDLSFETMLEPHLLDDLTIHDVLAMRTSKWGRFEEHRESLFDAVFELANSAKDDSEFVRGVSERLVEIRRAAGEIEAQRKSVRYKVKCELGKGALTAGLSVSTLLTLHAPLQSIAGILALGGIWVFDRAKEYGPELIQLGQQEREARRGAGFAMNRFFSQIEKKA